MTDDDAPEPDARAEMCPECGLVDLVIPVNQPTQEEQENCVFAEEENWQEVMEKKPLWSAEKIQEQKEKARKNIHERIREFQEKHRDVPYLVADIINEELEKFEEVFQQQ